MKPIVRITLVLAALSLTRAEAMPPQGATFYVSPSGSDANTGTSAAPWQTLQKAAASMGPGDTALIADGEYAGGVVQERDGMSGAPITFRAVNPGGAVVRGDATGAADAIALASADYVVIDGLTVRAANRAGISISRSNGVIVRRCRLLNNTRSGIAADGCDDLLLEGNESAFSVREHGISVSGSGDRPVIRLNRLHDNWACGITLNGDPEALDPSQGTRGDGITTGALVERNVIDGNGAGGAAGINLASVRASRIQNNLLFNNRAGGIAGWDDGAGIEWGTKENVILHNTVYFRPGEGRWCVSLKNGSTGNLVQNNILSGGARGALEIDNDSPIQSDYNLLLRAGKEEVATNEDDDQFVTLADWQSTTGNDTHSAVGEAGFAKAAEAPFDFHLQPGSPAVNTGADRTDVTLDLDGLIRPQNGRWDMGCYESGL
jgi:hypothetical protein